MRSQKVVAEHFQRNGFPYAESTGAGRSGVDITGMPGLAPEVKARSGFEPKAWLKQADSEARAGLPVVIFRCNGQGEANVGEWAALLRLDHFTDLIRQAGYGTPLDEPVHAEERKQARDDSEGHAAEEDDRQRVGADRPQPLEEGHARVKEAHDVERTA